MRLRVKRPMTKATIKSQNAIMTESAQNGVGAGFSRPRNTLILRWFLLGFVGCTGVVGCTGGKTPPLRRDRKNQKLNGRTLCSSARTRNARPYDRRFCRCFPLMTCGSRGVSQRGQLIGFLFVFLFFTILYLYCFFCHFTFIGYALIKNKERRRT